MIQLPLRILTVPFLLFGWQNSFDSQLIVPQFAGVEKKVKLNGECNGASVHTLRVDAWAGKTHVGRVSKR